MARQRFIHPNLWDDKKIAKLNPVERLFFIGCFSNADDEGRMLGDPAYLRSIIFKYDDLTVEQVRAIRDKVLEVNKNLVLYQVDNEEYLAFLKWKDYQKPKYPTPSKIPPIPETFLQPSGNVAATFPQPSEDVPETFHKPLGNIPGTFPQRSGNVPGTFTESFPYGMGRDGLGLDLDMDRDGLGEIPPDTTETEREILKELKSVKGYKFSYPVELAFIRKLAVDFPKLNTLQQIKSWVARKIDEPLKEKSKPHGQLENWFAKAEEWRKEKEATNGGYRPNIRPNARLPSQDARRFNNRGLD